ncbi:MAG TPA: DUF4328 domain-containing protein [Polyangiaceae bacterium]|jgi:hypothetical protein|nr:DUF4328 domain-containing protein [Polyangiaceae bacterium]
MSETGPSFAQRRAAVRLASLLARASVVAVAAAALVDAAVPSLAAWQADRATRLGVGTSALVLWSVAAVLFLFWVHRAVSNARRLGGTLRWGPGTAVVAYVVPVVSLVLPYYVMKALHTASDPSALDDVPVFRERADPGYREGARELVAPPRWDLAAPILAWWVLFDAVTLSNRFAGAGVVSTWWVACPLACGRLAAGVLCVLVVRSIDARQRERCRRLEAAPGPLVRTLERSERAD